jgi:hypothetical protein
MIIDYVATNTVKMLLKIVTTTQTTYLPVCQEIKTRSTYNRRSLILAFTILTEPAYVI